VTRTLVWDPAPGETRGLLLEEGQPVELHLLRDLGAKAGAQPGAVLNARLVSRLGNGRGLMLLDSGEEVLVRPLPAGPDGSSFPIVITRARLPEPGQWKRALARPAMQDEGDAHPVDPAAALIARADALLCARATDAPLAPAIPVRVDAEAVAEADLDGLLDQARTGLVPFPGGALSIERTRAMTIIDVDGQLSPRELNLAAAAAIGRALRLFQITGPVGIDFVGMASRADRQAVDAALAGACAPLGGHERTAINGFGFAQIVRPRTGPSIPEMLCGTTPGHLSAESQALALLRTTARMPGIGPRIITARPKVIDLIQRWPDLVDAVGRMTGADIKLVCDPAINGYGQVHVAPA
jgi:hypothetical protein